MKMAQATSILTPTRASVSEPQNLLEGESSELGNFRGGHTPGQGATCYIELVLTSPAVVVSAFAGLRRLRPGSRTRRG
jgi:hypothetical protein